jgi:exopolyphosphatase / guanosine-5'-triphosphate,3'-diphosphate pyrophosphatase
MDRPVAAIDVGTNTVLLLVARKDSRGAVVPVVDVQQVPRLGTGVDAHRRLHPEAMQRVIAVLGDYCSIAASHGVERIVACATSAVRDAVNRDEFVTLVRRLTGLHLEILSGEEEALWSYHGAISGIPSIGSCLVLDIGGGSTEMIAGNAQCITSRVSLNIGAVRLTERCFRHDPPLQQEIADASGLISSALDAVTMEVFPNTRLIAVAGTPTSLATLSLGLPDFSLEAVAGLEMNRSQIEDQWNRLRRLPSAEIRKLSNVMDGRADVITAGTLILRMVMDRLGLQALTVSERGLRYGLVLRAIKPD